ncbi:Auxin response factor 18-like protein [Drosera capensis]
MIPSMEQNRVAVENCLDSQLWHACAGGMIQMPAVNTKVFYFVQGHIEHATGSIDFRTFPRIRPYILCRVEVIKYLADQESDEVYARIRLVPVSANEGNEHGDEDVGVNGSDLQRNKPASFAKTLTQSDANNGGGFSVPRYCAETIFPRLDYSADPPVQNIVAKDVHGEAWKFRHIYRGTPRRHLLTTGWSVFVNAKKLVAGDSIVFLRTEKGELCVGIRRVKRGPISSSGWNPESSFMQYSDLSAFLKEDSHCWARNCNGVTCASRFKGKVTAESVVEAATYAANGQPFEVMYYPRAGTPEFVVKAGLVKSAMQIRWCSGMRFKMPFETEDSSRTSWFMGTILTVHVADATRWPESPWRLLQVTWDEPDLLQNVKRVSPWLVELVSNMPSVHLSPLSPPRKKFRFPGHPDFLVDGQLQMPGIPGNFLGPIHPFGYLPDNSPAGMQGARHAQFGLNLRDLRINTLQSGFFPGGYPSMDPAATLLTVSPNSIHVKKPSNSDDISRLLTIGSSIRTPKITEQGKRAPFVLFGKTILTEAQMSQSSSGGTASPAQTVDSSSDGIADKTGNSSDVSGSAMDQNDQNSKRSSAEIYKDSRQEVDSDESEESGHCKVFMESEDLGHTLDLSVLSSYEELCRKLVGMLLLEDGPDVLHRVIYRDPNGLAKPIGDEPFSEFSKSAKRLTILSSSSGTKIEAR